LNLRWAYFKMFWTYVECSLIAMGIAAVMMGVQYATSAVSQLKEKLPKLTTVPYLDFYSLAAVRYKFDVALAGVLFLAWIRVRPLPASRTVQLGFKNQRL